VAGLPVGQQQMVEIAKALAAKACLLALDEPTSALTGKEADHLFELLVRLKESGVGIIYISHRMRELEQLCDRVTVLRDGRRVETRPMREMTIPELIRLMVGRAPEEEFPSRAVELGDVVLQVEGLSRRGAFENISFEVRRGEIFGIAGLMGAGRTELLRCVFGADPVDGGRVLLEGRPLPLGDPAASIGRGMALLPEDRKLQGLILGLSVRENINLPSLDQLSRWPGFVAPADERAAAERGIRELGIRTPSPEQRVASLSGGNQQKVVLAKWLSTGPKVLLLDEPTRGIDVAAKAEIYQVMNRLAKSGMALVMVSSELPEVLGMSDRIAVLHEGRLAGLVSRSHATQERLMALATGQVPA
jgi:ribose transport system ATP-binding protein